MSHLSTLLKKLNKFSKRSLVKIDLSLLEIFSVKEQNKRGLMVINLQPFELRANLRFAIADGPLQQLAQAI